MLPLDRCECTVCSILIWYLEHLLSDVCVLNRSRECLCSDQSISSDHAQAFFWTFRKKLKAKKTQAEKKLKQIFENLKQIIQKLYNLPTKN